MLAILASCLTLLPYSLVEVEKPTVVWTGRSQFNRVFVSLPDGRIFDVDLPSGAILRSFNTGGALFNATGIDQHYASGEGFLFTQRTNGLFKWPMPVREMPTSVRFASSCSLLIRNGRVTLSNGAILRDPNDVLVQRVNYRVSSPPSGEIIEWADLSLAMKPNLEYVYLLHVVTVGDGTLSLFVNETFMSRAVLGTVGFPIAIYGSMGPLESSRFSDSRRIVPEKSWLMLTADHRALVIKAPEEQGSFFWVSATCVVLVAVFGMAFRPELGRLLEWIKSRRRVIEISEKPHADVMQEVLLAVASDDGLARATVESETIILSPVWFKRGDIGKSIGALPIWAVDRGEGDLGDLIQRLEGGQPPQELLEHPAFWDYQKRAEFCTDELARLLLWRDLEQCKTEVFDGSWVDCYRREGKRFECFMDREIEKRYIGDDRVTLKSLVKYIQSKRLHRQETADALGCDREEVFDELLRPFPRFVRVMREFARRGIDTSLLARSICQC
jgi:hypothetical protein